MLQNGSVEEQAQQGVHRRGTALGGSCSLVAPRGGCRAISQGRAGGGQAVAAQPAQAGVALPQRAQHAAPAAQDVILLHTTCRGCCAGSREQTVLCQCRHQLLCLVITAHA